VFAFGHDENFAGGTPALPPMHALFLSARIWEYSRQIIRSHWRNCKTFLKQILIFVVETSPVNCPPGSPKFVTRLWVWFRWKMKRRRTLLRKLRKLEKKFGRQPKKVLNEARSLDLDLIAFGNETWNSSGLVLPHPRAHLRRFVLQPLSEMRRISFCPGRGERWPNCWLVAVRRNRHPMVEFLAEDALAFPA